VSASRPMKAAVGRADLVRLIIALPADQVDRAAAQLGFGAPSPLKPVVPNLSEARSEELQTRRVPSVMAPTHYLRPEALSILEAPEPTPSKGRAEGADYVSLTEEDLRSPGHSLFAIPPTPPLTPWSRLWPMLRTMLQGNTAGRAPNVSELVRVWGRGEVLRRIPCVVRRAWSGRASVWVDRSPRLVPFWSDQADVCRRLRKVCGQSGLEVRTLDSRILALALAQRRPLPAGLANDPLSPVLVLGDLGTFGSVAERAVWLGVARRLRSMGVRLTALGTKP
jgi:hypothetical protein